MDSDFDTEMWECHRQHYITHRFSTRILLPTTSILSRHAMLLLVFCSESLSTRDIMGFVLAAHSAVLPSPQSKHGDCTACALGHLTRLTNQRNHDRTLAAAGSLLIASHQAANFGRPAKTSFHPKYFGSMCLMNTTVGNSAPSAEVISAPAMKGPPIMACCGGHIQQHKA